MLSTCFRNVFTLGVFFHGEPKQIAVTSELLNDVTTFLKRLHD